MKGPRVAVGVVRGAVTRDSSHEMLMNGHNHVTIQMDPSHLIQHKKSIQYVSFQLVPHRSIQTYPQHTP